MVTLILLLAKYFLHLSNHCLRMKINGVPFNLSLLARMSMKSQGGATHRVRYPDNYTQYAQRPSPGDETTQSCPSCEHHALPAGVIERNLVASEFAAFLRLIILKRQDNVSTTTKNEWSSPVKEVITLTGRVQNGGEPRSPSSRKLAFMLVFIF
jgi:hypothetical protein